METGQASLQGAGVVLHKDGSTTPFVISGEVPPGQEEATQRLVDRFNSQYLSHQQVRAAEAAIEDDPDDAAPPIGDDPDDDPPLPPDPDDDPDELPDPPGELDPQGV